MTLKKELKLLLESKDFDKIISLNKQNRRVLTKLQSFLYDPHSVITWRALEAIGLVCGSISDEKPEIVKDTIRRFFWSLTDEAGATPWCSIQAIGEIIRNDPERYNFFIPNVAYYLWDENINGYVLWSLGRIAEKSQEVEKHINEIALYLDHKDSTRRGFAAYALNSIGSNRAKKLLQKVQADNAKFTIYKNGDLIEMAVAEVAQSSI